MALIVKNKSRSTFVLNLQQGVDYGDGLAPLRIQTHRSVTLPDGTSGLQEVTRQVPASLSWLPGEQKDAVPDAAAQIPEFRTAVTRGILAVVEPSVPRPDAG